MTLTEENLQFDFDPTWTELVKYDEHEAIRKASGKHLTCIDFLGILDNDKVVLIEVKNYKNRPPIQYASIVAKLSPDSQSTEDKEAPLIKTIVKNVRDSLLFITFFSKRNQVADAPYWAGMKQKLEDAVNQIHVVLWLELETSYPNLPAKTLLVAKNAILNKLAQRLSWLTRNVVVADILHNPFQPSLSVKTL
jgi:hypothetical protein